MAEDKAAVLEAAVPILQITDLSEALDYYERVLGFQPGWKWGDPANRASVCRDNVELNLSQSSEAKTSISRVYFQMTGVDAYYRSVMTAGARVTVPLADRPYGMRDLRLVDPDGNELSFGEPSAS
jgi:uncharacterized glyoxalase superfamily protein PhnB